MSARECVRHNRARAKTRPSQQRPPTLYDSGFWVVQQVSQARKKSVASLRTNGVLATDLLKVWTDRNEGTARECQRHVHGTKHGMQAWDLSNKGATVDRATAGWLRDNSVRERAS